MLLILIKLSYFYRTYFSRIAFLVCRGLFSVAFFSFPSDSFFNEELQAANFRTGFDVFSRLQMLNLCFPSTVPTFFPSFEVK